MKIREDIAELLRAGTPQLYICRQLHVAPITVQRTRETLGLPAPKPGPPAPRTFEDAFRKFAEPADDGHVHWSGPAKTDGVPLAWVGPRARSAYRIAFEQHYGREPVGRVKTTCGQRSCVAGPHLADQPIREANRRADKAYSTIFGGSTA